MKKIRLATAVFTALMCITLTMACLYTRGIREFTFVCISDVHIPSYGFPIGQKLDEDTLMQLHNQIRLKEFVTECLAMDSKPAFVINCGDTGDVGWMELLNLYVRLMQPLVDAGIPVYTAVGNHDLDYTGIGSEDLAEIFNPLGPAKIGRHGTRYSFDHNGCHFVFLNNRPITGLIRLNPKEVAWLANDLKSVKKDTPVLLFLHANMLDEDTHHIAELLQSYRHSAIFQGHRHSAGIDRWGGVPVVLTGSLYGGKPEAGSYRIVTVRPDGIVTRTRDFAQPAGIPEPAEVIEYSLPGPELRVIRPENNSVAGENVSIEVTTNPTTTGTVEYRIPGFNEWATMQGGNGTWEATAQAPANPGRHLLMLRFTGADGSIVLAHRVFIVPGEKVREKWAQDLGSAVLGSPVILRDLAIIPTVEGGVYALRLSNGETAWHRTADEGHIIGRVVPDGDMIYYGAGRTIIACDAGTGKPRWQTPVGGTVIAGLTAGKGRLFVPAGEHKLYCLDARSGKILWEYTVPRSIMMEPATDGNRVFFGAMDGCVRALDASTGKEVWINRLSSPDDSYTTAPFWPPVIAGDKVIVRKFPVNQEEMNLVALSASSGKPIWSHHNVSGPLRMVVCPETDRFYMSYSENRQQGLQCLSAKDGSLLWSSLTGVGMSNGIASRDAVLSRDGYNICRVDAGTGMVQWTYKTSTGPQGSYYGPGATAMKDKMVVAGTMDGWVIALTWQVE